MSFRLYAPAYLFWLAKLFGKRHELVSADGRVVFYAWRGHRYLTELTPPLAASRGEKGE